MRIIVDNGAYTLRNMGDVAMLQVAISRIRGLHPFAEVLVLTRRPDLLQRYCPGTLPLSATSRDAIYARSGTGMEQLPIQDSGTAAVAVTSGNPSGMPAQSEEFARAFKYADILVVAGGGFLNDLNAKAASAVLLMAKHGLDTGKRVIFLSQGLGPIGDPFLLSTLSEVCRAGAFIGLREPCHGPAAVLKAGAIHGRWAVTGDDALELPCAELKSAVRENYIGFSVRHVGYSGINEHQIRQIATGLSLLLEKTGAAVMPLPVSFNSFENDEGAIENITGERASPMRMDAPHHIVDAAGRCRMVVAGTYHAAVFALAQGVPCVCLHASAYYRAKMEGLAAQFGHGCAVIDISRGDIAAEIATRGLEVWNQSQDYHESLVLRAAEQVRAAQTFCLTALSCAEPRTEVPCY